MKVFCPKEGLGVDKVELRRRFHREARYLERLDHPNVVRLIGSKTEDDPPSFIMELADCSLREYLERSPLTTDAKTAIVLDVLAGLEAIHLAGYKHRDLKPDNILVFGAGTESPKFSLSDFGLMAPPDQMTTKLTLPGANGGTPLYASPEAMRNWKHVTTRSDIYSIGAILHDLFVGEARVPCSQLSGPGLMGKVIEGCTEANPTRRFRDVAALREAFIAAVAAGPIEPLSIKDQEIVEFLTKEELSLDEWDRVDLRLQENDANGKSNGAILQAIKPSHIVVIPPFLEGVRK